MTIAHRLNFKCLRHLLVLLITIIITINIIVNVSVSVNVNVSVNVGVTIITSVVVVVSIVVRVITTMDWHPATERYSIASSCIDMDSLLISEMVAVAAC
jgi:hypothetical protein